MKEAQRALSAYSHGVQGVYRHAWNVQDPCLSCPILTFRHIRQSGLTHALTALTGYLNHFVSLNSLSEGMMNRYVYQRQGQHPGLLNTVHFSTSSPNDLSFLLYSLITLQ